MRYFQIFYVEGGYHYNRSATQDGFPNEELVIKDIKKSYSSHVSIQITNVFEFKSKQDYEDFNREIE